ncbi:MAG: hypothetical protein K8T91_07835 [Planctomycetes bacterium]|nr:hypothetical protein [Planctomycetota bacterium]
MECVDPEFATFLSPFVEALDQHASAAYGLWPDLRLAYFNPSWFAFAAANDGEPDISSRWPLGASIADLPAPPLSNFYRILFGRCLATNSRREFEYDCSSADVDRRFHMVIRPLGKAAGLLIINTLRLEHPHDESLRPKHDAIEQQYRDRNGIIRMCMNCRGINRLSNPAAWDWVPAWVRVLPDNVSHGLCPVCASFYMAQLNDSTVSI